MLIIAGDEESERIRSSVEERLGGHIIKCTCTDSCEGAWKQVTYNPYKFGMVLVGSCVTDHVEEEDVRYIQRICTRNPRILIAMCTTREFLPYCLFRIPSFYTFKSPAKLRDIQSMLERASVIEKIRNGRPGALIPAYNGSDVQMIPASAILYAQKTRNGLTLMTECGEIPHRRRMDEFERTAGGSFFRCHTSYIVNIVHVTEIRSDVVILDNGDSLPVSRNYKNQVHRYLDFYSISAADSVKQLK